MLKLDRHRGTLALAAALLATGALTGVALAGWVEHGATMFMTLAETGLSWCF